MQTSDFDYHLPPEYIAQTPLEPRDHSRLMVVSRAEGSIQHHHFFEIVDLLQEGDVLVFNDSRVIPARLIGHKAESEGKVEEQPIYCRKCTRQLSPKEFYDSSDGGFIDTNGKLSVCKSCIQALYDSVFSETGSMEQAIHKLCTSLNVKYSNDAASATKSHISSFLESGKKVSAVFGIYKSRRTRFFDN